MDPPFSKNKARCLTENVKPRNFSPQAPQPSPRPPSPFAAKGRGSRRNWKARRGCKECILEPYTYSNCKLRFCSRPGEENERQTESQRNAIWRRTPGVPTLHQSEADPVAIEGVFIICGRKAIIFRENEDIYCCAGA